MRKRIALLISAGLIVGLTACSAGPLDGCTPSATPGPASTLVKSTGAFERVPTIDFPTPLITSDVEASTLIDGDGARVSSGDTVLLQYAIAEGSTGVVVGTSDYNGDPQVATLGSGSLASVVSEGLQCATVGSRVAVVASADRTHQGQTGGAFDVDASLIYVLDVLGAFPGKADGTGQVPDNSLPAVVTAPDGTPGITIPSKTPPTEFTVAPLQLADGPEISPDDRVVVKFTGVGWDSAAVFDSSWTDGTAVVVSGADRTFPQSVVDAIRDHTVGSQILVVVPPLGDDPQGAMGAPSNTTLIYVIDILGVIGE